MIRAHFASASLVVLALLVGILHPAAAFAQITIGPYSFPDATPFADTIDYTGPMPMYVGAASTPMDALGGYSPATAMVNVGYSGAATIRFGFTDELIRNDTGADAVVFDARYSADDYEIAVQPRGGAMTAFMPILSSAQVSTGVTGPGGALLWGVEIDLSTYGLAAGAIVDTIIVRGDPATNPAGRAELDPVMAAAIHAGGCASDAECTGAPECTAGTCVAMACVNTSLPAGTACTDGVCDGDPTAPACVECLEDTHCAAPTPRCETGTHTCVACLVATDCDDANECTVDACDSTMICINEALPAGTECTDGVCNGDPTTPTCIECTSDADCSEFAPRCVMNRCISCTMHSDCDDLDACTDDRCDIDGECVHQALDTPECRATDAGIRMPDGGTSADGGGALPPPRRAGGCACDVLASGPDNVPLSMPFIGAALVLTARARRRQRARRGRDARRG